jgi:hypothetical protein
MRTGLPERGSKMVRVIEKLAAPRVQHHALESCAWLYLGRHTRLILSKLRASPLSRAANPLSTAAKGSVGG